MKNKIVEFFKSKGYIFIALICLAAVIAAGVSIINLNNEDVDEPVAAYRTQSRFVPKLSDRPAGVLLPASYPHLKRE